jgi:uncharacterized protein (DUF2062 family)
LSAIAYNVVMDFRKYLPTREQLRKTRSLQFLGDVMFNANLWHFNRHSLSLAVLIGGFCTFLPIPFQMIPTIMICIWIRCNIPVAVAVVWISNPITMPAMMYFAYRVGAWMMGIEATFDSQDPSLEVFGDQLLLVMQPLLLGCLVCGATVGLTGFFAVRLYYRWRVARYIRRKQRGVKSRGITRI